MKIQINIRIIAIAIILGNLTVATKISNANEVNPIDELQNQEQNYVDLEKVSHSAQDLQWSPTTSSSWELLDARLTSQTDWQDVDNSENQSTDKPETIASSSEASETSDIGTELSNPATALSSIGNKIRWQTFTGDLPDADEQSVVSYTLQPVFPFPQANGKNIIFRPALPVIFNQPFFDSDTLDFESSGIELGDISFDLAYGGTSESGLITLYGLISTLPTSTFAPFTGVDEWRIGPEFVIGILKDWGVAGLFPSHQWGITGDAETSITSLQYFYAINLGNSWQIASGPTISYNWSGDDGERWTVPLGVGVAKTTQIGKLPVKLQVDFNYFLEQPDSFGADWFLEFRFTPVVKNPFI